MSMRFFITKNVLLWVILLLCAVIFAIFLTSCGHAGLRPPDTGDGKTGVSGPGGALASLAIWATWAAGVGLLCCGVAAFFLPNKLNIAKVALGCLAALAVAGILHWISAHWAVLVGLCAGVCVLGGIGYAYIHRKALERCTGIDIDRDGKTG